MGTRPRKAVGLGSIPRHSTGESVDSGWFLEHSYECSHASHQRRLAER